MVRKAEVMKKYGDFIALILKMIQQKRKLKFEIEHFILNFFTITCLLAQHVKSINQTIKKK